MPDSTTCTAATTTTTSDDASSLMERRKSLLQKSWKAVGDTLGVQATQLFYQRLFEQYPDVQPLFADTDMEAQAQKLLKTITMAVEFLDHMDELVPKLQALGRTHACWKVQREHYNAVGASLLWTLEQGLGSSWTPEMAEAWTWVYGVISTTMADAGESLQVA